MDSRAIQNVISSKLCEKMGFKPEEFPRRISTATGQNAKQLGVLKSLPITLGRIDEDMDFLVLEGCPYELTIGLPQMRKINGVLDCGKKVLIARKTFSKKYYR